MILYLRNKYIFAPFIKYMHTSILARNENTFNHFNKHILQYKSFYITLSILINNLKINKFLVEKTASVVSH